MRRRRIYCGWQVVLLAAALCGLTACLNWPLPWSVAALMWQISRFRPSSTPILIPITSSRRPQQKIEGTQDNLPGSLGASRFFGPRCGGAVGAHGPSVERLDDLRGLQIAPAQNAAHGYGIDEVGVGPTLAVRADFCGHHRIPLPSRAPCLGPVPQSPGWSEPREVIVNVAQSVAGGTRIFSTIPSGFLLEPPLSRSSWDGSNNSTCRSRLW